MGKGLFTTDNIDSRMLYKEFQQGVESYNDVTWALLSKFVRKTDKETVKVWERDMEFVESSEGYLETWQKIHSRSVNLALTDFALGFGFTKQAIQDSNANELRETQKAAMRAHQRLLAKRFFYKVMAPADNAGFWDANMTTRPPAYKGNTFATGHNHYTTSGVSAPTLANINGMKKDIREHGYLGQLYMFANSALIEDLENLAGWTSVLTPVSAIEIISKEGFRAIKRFQEFTWVIEDWVPDNYLVAIDAELKPITMREPLQVAGRGLKLFEGPYSDMPLREAYYESRFDMDIVHRGAGSVMQITTSASYTKPTSFTFQT